MFFIGNFNTVGFCIVRYSRGSKSELGNPNTIPNQNVSIGSFSNALFLNTPDRSKTDIHRRKNTVQKPKNTVLIWDGVGNPNHSPFEQLLTIQNQKVFGFRAPTVLYNILDFTGT